MSSLRTYVLYLVLPGLLLGCGKKPAESIIEVPDQAFLGALVDQGVDRNGDGRISQSEAESTLTLVIPPSGIRSTRGLEAFIHLESFTITLNPLESLDVSANTALRYLECTNCELTELDLSRNTALETLVCGRNALQDLDLSANISLTRLISNNNLFSSLDLSANTSLITMISCGNQLTRLDISMLTSLTKIGYDNMPMLTEVCVWTLPFPPAGVVVLREYSPNVVYTTGCSR